MTRLRIFFACFVLLALPLQGHAAAGMLFCGGHGGAGSPAAHVAGAQHVHVQSEAAVGGHSHHRQHASAGETRASPHVAKADPGHRCVVCASCCNLVAVASAATVIPPGAAPPRAELRHAVLRVPTWVTLVPDKPPRA